MRLIDADVLREHVFALTEHVGDERLHIDAVAYLIDDALTVDAVPVVHGRWIEDPDDDWGCRCSECGHLELYQFDYCSSCGARMDGEHDS